MVEIHDLHVRFHGASREAVAGIDLTEKEFWRGALQTVAQQIDLVCGLLEGGNQ